MDVAFILRNRGFSIESFTRETEEKCEYFGRRGKDTLRIIRNSRYKVILTADGETIETTYGYWDGSDIDDYLSLRYPATSYQDWQKIHIEILEKEGFKCNLTGDNLYAYKGNNSIAIVPNTDRFYPSLCITSYRGQNSLVDRLNLHRIQLDTLFSAHRKSFLGE